jgi:outer membrane receptor protein involved in Fe transport
MNKTVKWFAALSTVVLLFGYSNFTLAQGLPDDEEAGAIEEVVVTAMKRGEQLILDIPASISAFTGERLAETGAYSLKDFLQMAPGVSLSQNGGASFIQIRGIASGLGSATVGYYIDESPFGFVSLNRSPDSRVFDMERVEVLRGPQGTLYGQGAISGVIRYITKSPDLNNTEFVADVSGSNTKDGGFNQQYNVGFGIPIIEDKLAIRVSGTYEDLSGWIDGRPGMGFDLFGVPITFNSGPDLNTEEHKSARVKMLWTPSERSTVTALYWWSETLNGNPDQSMEDRTNTFAIPQPLTSEYKYGYLTYSYEGDSFTFLSNTAFTDAVDTSHLDFLGTDLFSLIDNNGWSQEFRFNSTSDGPWFWTFGGLYSEYDQRIFQDVDQRIADAFGLDDVDQNDNTTNWALFGDVTYEFSEQWNVSIGARYFDDKRVTTDIIGVYIGDEEIVQKFDDISPRFNVAFHPNENSTVFFQAAKGFRSGLNQFPISLFAGRNFGIELPPGAASEDLWAYELGYKGEFNDGKFFLEAAVFLNDWTNLQQSVPVVIGVLSGILNAGEAKSPGVELGMQFQPTDRISFGGNVSWNDAAYSTDVGIDAINPATGGLDFVVLFPKDSRIATVPEWTANAWADFR